ncbi:mitochondrial import inner membrane translocase subunit TIM17-3-like [Brachypodium distachyon]|uniref:mitochondrial import inner membrane translocase subunit TIM17-3-like n=1 Tax=Brachypodium distachyon TaxID=15368 RepID=UPI0001C753FD|nr:mitochondrial import inner membrane translocase subunit TIM17-3-like [Brachypodium distachyon]|eukprot:XP_010229517.1 mitochondrial import inner membrane translocase subunit TIM17-3-like [Brachypodium distachyon]
MPHPDIKRCPDCIIDSAGCCFVAGAIGASAYHFPKGLYNSPNGQRLAAGARAVRINAPRVGGSLAAFGVCLEAFRCAMLSARKTDDFWSYVLPWFAAGICVPVPLGRGPRAVAISALTSLSFSVLAYGLRFCIGRVDVASLFPPPSVDSGPSGSSRED